MNLAEQWKRTASGLEECQSPIQLELARRFFYAGACAQAFATQNIWERFQHDETPRTILLRALADEINLEEARTEARKAA